MAAKIHTVPKRNGGEKRGSSRNRHVRKMRMLSDPEFNGNGQTCECVHCGRQLDYDTVTADRIIPGGVYAYINVQASCLPCNIQRGTDPNWNPRSWRRGAGRASA